MALGCVVEPGDARIGPLVEQFGARDVWGRLRDGGGESAWARRAAALDLRSVRLLARHRGLRFLVPGDDEWPGGLTDLDACEPVQGMRGAPLGLWALGRPLPSGQDAVAMVGSRASSAYGDRVAAEMAADLAAQGLAVVSGAAFGIDAAAHRGALAADGMTVAVLAAGLDEPYPRAHAALLAEIAARGTVVSEAPPGTTPTRPRFLARNRLIAALCQGTVMVEAAARSGARNTVTWAHACGRMVMAVPGPVTSATSYTPHRLVRDGEAVLVTGAADVRELLAPAGEALVERPPQDRLLDGLTDAERALYEALPGRGARSTDELALIAGLSLPASLSGLGTLSERGLVRAEDDGLWRLGPVQDRPVRRPRRGRGDGRASS